MAKVEAKANDRRSELADEIARGEADRDHIVPKSRGGGDERANLQVAHRGCNSRKGNR